MPTKFTLNIQQVGIGKIHIYLHMTVDDTAHLLEPYVLAGQVILRNWDFDWTNAFPKIQMHALNDCLARGSASPPPPSWLFLIDVDEFVVVSRRPDTDEGNRSLSQVLDEVGGDANAIKLSWLQFSDRDKGKLLVPYGFRV